YLENPGSNTRGSARKPHTTAPCPLRPWVPSGRWGRGGRSGGGGPRVRGASGPLGRKACRCATPHVIEGRRTVAVNDAMAGFYALHHTLCAENYDSLKQFVRREGCPLAGLECYPMCAMRCTVRAWIAAVVLSLGLTASVVAGPFEDGMAAYWRG